MILQDWPGTWAEAWAAHGSDWEPETHPVYARHDVPREVGGFNGGFIRVDERFKVIEEWQQIVRSDSGEILSLQQKTYRVIKNSEFGALIETVMGLDLEDELKFESVFELYGGKMVLAVLYFDTPVAIPGDPSQTVRYLVFTTRHDGQGGWRILLTNVRVVCANTLGMAEDSAREGQSAFTIRHTANWDERTAEVRDKLILALRGAAAYQEFANALMLTGVKSDRRDRFLEKLLIVDSGMSLRQQTNRERERDQIRTILQGPTCEGIDKTAWGLLNAVTEWSDHYRRSHTESGYVNRQLLVREPTKARALSLVREMAGIK